MPESSSATRGVKAIVPAEGVTYGSYCVSIMRNPPHPNAARLLADFYLSDEAQGVYANTGHGIVIRDLKTPVTPEMQPLAAEIIDGRPFPAGATDGGACTDCWAAAPLKRPTNKIEKIAKERINISFILMD